MITQYKDAYLTAKHIYWNMDNQSNGLSEMPGLLLVHGLRGLFKMRIVNAAV